jgi:hypothetical protein
MMSRGWCRRGVRKGENVTIEGCGVGHCLVTDGGLGCFMVVT